MTMPEGYDSSFEYGDQAPARHESRHVVAIRASQVRREAVVWLPEWDGRVPRSMVTILAGVPGLGKSTLACVLAASNPGATLIATAEDSPEATVRPRLEAAGADLERVHFVVVRLADGLEDGIVIPDDTARLDELVAETQATLVIVDPLVAHLGAGIDSHKDQPVRRALAPLYRLAQGRSCAVVAVIHLNKAQGLAPLARLSGSGAFGAAARSVLLLDRDPDDDEHGRRRVLAHIKCNVGPEMPSLLYEIEPVVLPDDAVAPMVETARLKLLGESEHDAHSILALPSGEARSALEDAAEFLLAELNDGKRHPASDVRRAARSLGISDGTLDRARKRLGVETEKADFGGGWTMWLPKNPTCLDSSEGESVDSSRDWAETNGLGGIGAPEESTSEAWTLGDEDDPLQVDAEHYRSVLAQPLVFGDDGFLPRLYERLERGLITEAEWHEADRAHRFVVARKRRESKRSRWR